jgi:sec-independent protein translocase protein TatC
MVAVPRFLRRRTDNPEGRMSVLDHLRELRRRMIIIVLIIGAGAIIGWELYNPLLDLLKRPYCEVPYPHRLGGVKGDSSNCKLFFTAPLEGFTTRLKISVIAGAVVTAPFWLHQVWGFITPGLHRNERKYTRIFVASSTGLFALGVLLAYLILEKALRYLILAGGSGTAALLTIGNYISFVVLVLVVFGAAFELPLLIVMANLAGVLSGRVLKKSQRLAIFLIFVFAAVATPSTDPFTMCAMAFPMVLLFEGAVLFAVMHDKRKARRKAAEAADERLDDLTPSRVDAIPTPLGSDDQWTDTT